MKNCASYENVKEILQANNIIKEIKINSKGQEVLVPHKDAKVFLKVLNAKLKRLAKNEHNLTLKGDFVSFSVEGLSFRREIFDSFDGKSGVHFQEAFDEGFEEDFEYASNDDSNADIPDDFFNAGEEADGFAPDDLDFGDYFTNFGSYTRDLTPDYAGKPKLEVLLQNKKYLLKRLKNALSEIKAQKDIYSKDKKKLLELTRHESLVKEHIYGSNVKDEVSGLENEIKDIVDLKDFEKFEFYAEKDFKFVEDVISSGFASDYREEIKAIVGFYQAVGQFNANTIHPVYYTVSEDGHRRNNFINEKGENKVDEGAQEFMVKMKAKADSLEIKLQTEAWKDTENMFKTNDKYKKLLGEQNFDFEKISHSLEGLKDIGFFEKFALDLATDKSLLAQMAHSKFSDEMEKALADTKEAATKIDELKPKVDKILNGDYSVFRAVNSLGLTSNRIVNRFSSLFQDLNEASAEKFKSEFSGDTADKTSAMSVRDSWLQDNTVIVDIRKLPEIYDFVGGSDNVEHSRHQVVDKAKHRKELIALLGDKGYAEVIRKQSALLEDYEASLTIERDKYMAIEGVTDVTKLSIKNAAKITRWKIKNSPYERYKSYEKRNYKKGFNVGEYNLHVPKSNKGKYYDKNFTEIESNEDLKAFHDLLVETTNKVYQSIPVEDRRSTTEDGILSLERDYTEILFDKDMTFWQRFSSVIRNILEDIKMSFTEQIAATDTKNLVNPLTNKRDAKVESGYMTTNAYKIDSQYKLVEIRLRTLLGVGTLDAYDRFDVTNKPKVLAMLAEQLGVSRDSLKNHKVIKSVNLNNVPIGNLFKKIITHDVVQENTTDLPKVLRLYSNLAAQYSARKQSLPLMEQLRSQYKSVQKYGETSSGDKIRNNDEIIKDGERENAHARFDSWFNRVVLNNYHSKNEFGDSRVKHTIDLFKKRKTSDKDVKLDQKKLFTKEDKELALEIPHMIRSVEAEISATNDPERIKELNKDLGELTSIQDRLGGHVTLAAVFDNILRVIRLKSLGWSLSSATTNFIEGQFSNCVMAASGKYFSQNSMARALHIVAGNSMKSLSFGLAVSKGAKKNNMLMRRYDIMQDSANDLQKASVDVTSSGWKEVIQPFTPTKRVEFANQSAPMVAMLIEQEIVGKNGEKSNVWDALDEDGGLLDNFDTEANRNNWVYARGDKYLDFKSRIVEAIKENHGDYHDLSGNMMAETMTGKSVGMFKKWMTRAISSRFLAERQNLNLGLSQKGRLRSHTAMTGSLYGAVIGSFGGPVGTLVGGAVGLGISKFTGAKSNMSALKQMAFIGKELAYVMLGIPTRVITGRNLYDKRGDYNALVASGVSEVDARNLRMIFFDIAQSLGFFLVFLLIKSMLWEDDEDKDGKKRAAHNYLINKVMQLNSQANSYASPTSMWENLTAIGPVRFFNDVFKVVDAGQKAVQGEDTLTRGEDAGKSRLWKITKKTFLPSMLQPGLGFESTSKLQFEKTVLDSWFQSEEKKFKQDRLTHRSLLRKKYTDDGLEKKEVEKAVNRISRPLKRGETEREWLEAHIEEEIDF